MVDKSIMKQSSELKRASRFASRLARSFFDFAPPHATRQPFVIVRRTDRDSSFLELFGFGLRPIVRMKFCAHALRRLHFCRQLADPLASSQTHFCQIWPGSLRRLESDSALHKVRLAALPSEQTMTAVGQYLNRTAKQLVDLARRYFVLFGLASATASAWPGSVASASGARHSV